HAVDGAAFLRAAGEVHAAQQRRLARPAAAERGVDELGQLRAVDAELLREAVDRGAPLQVALFLQARRQQRVEASLEARELLVEARAGRAGHLGRVERRPPHLRAAAGVKFAEELVE